MVDMFLVCRRHILRLSCCSVEKTSKKPENSLKIEDFDRFGSVGILFFLPKIRSISVEIPKRPFTSMGKHINTPNVLSTYLVTIEGKREHMRFFDK